MKIENYICNFTCGECNEHNKMDLTKYQAAFFDSLNIKIRCKNCGSNKTSNLDYILPKIDDELLMKWLANEKLYFIQQDEDLIMKDISTERLITAVNSASPARTEQLLRILRAKLHGENFSSTDEKITTISYLESYNA